MDRHEAVEQIPVDIAVEETAEGVCYRFPVRDWPSRWVGWVLLMLGILLVAAACGLAPFAAVAPFWPAGALVLGISGVLGGLGLLVCLWGQNTLGGRAEILLRGEQLIAREITGRARWTRRCAANNLKRLLVVYELQHVSESVLKTTQLKQIAFRLVLEYESGRQRRLVKWYARERLEPVARDITRRLRLPEPVAVQMGPSDAQQPLVQPAGSMIALERNADGLSLIIPPLGLLRSEDGRSVTKLVGGGAAGSIAGVFTMVMFTSFGPWWIWALFALPALGGALFVTAGLLGQRDTYIDIVGDTLLISTRGWRGVRQHQWKRDDLKDIALGDSTIELSDEYLPQLHITPKEGDAVQLLTGRRRDEVTWVAHVVREALAMDRREDV